MGLCINSGPKWEDDYLNKINFYSMKTNASKMIEERLGFLERECVCKTNKQYWRVGTEDGHCKMCSC